MADRALREPWVQDILRSESSPIRFEDTCIEVFSDAEGIHYVRTSRSYDLGRDGRDASPRSGPIPPMICCSLEDHFDSKAEKDLRRIMQSCSPTTLLFCSTQPLTEYAGQAIENKARTICSSLETLRVNGLEQLSQLIMRYPRAFLHNYAGELANLREALFGDGGDQERLELTGMRVALTTQLHADFQARRSDLTRNLILTALAAGNNLTAGQIAKSVSDKLRLHRIVHEAYLSPSLESLANEQYITFENGTYALAANGREELQRRTDAGTRRLLEGRASIHKSVLELSGITLNEQESRRFWNVMQDELTNVFLARGIVIIESVAEIMEGTSAVSDYPDLQDAIDNLGRRIAALGLGDHDTRYNDLSRAVVDVFSDKNSSAFAWLTSLCQVFVDVCSLGLETYSQQAITKRLREVELILDTDIVLSLLSEGEPNHLDVKSVVAGWRKIDGRLYVLNAMLEEATHHAWIADKDFDNCWRLLDTMSDTEAAYLIRNVFVRGFRLVAKRKYTTANWRKYISAFRSRDENDHSHILELLRDEGVDLLAENLEDQPLADRIARVLLQDRKERMGLGDAGNKLATIKKKCDRDGRLTAFLIGRRKKVRVYGHNTVIVSTSGSLRAACGLERTELGEPSPIFSLAAISWLLALVPGVHLEAGTLRTLLFSDVAPESLGNLDLVAMRVLKASREHDMHISRRGTLKRIMWEKIAELAHQLDRKPRQVETELLAGGEENNTMLAEVVAEAVDEFSRSQSEDEIMALKKQIEQLENELATRRSSTTPR